MLLLAFISLAWLAAIIHTNDIRREIRRWLAQMNPVPKSEMMDALKAFLQTYSSPQTDKSEELEHRSEQQSSSVLTLPADAEPKVYKVEDYLKKGSPAYKTFRVSIIIPL